MRKILALVMIGMIILLGISIERDIVISKRENPYDQYINYNMTVYPDNLKLTNGVDIREKDLLVNLFQGLVKEDENGMIVGALAEDFQVSQDGLEYNFILRKELRYSTGEKINSQDFVDFFEAFLEDEDNIYREDLDCIYGVRDYREGLVDFSQVAIIPKDDRLTIRLNYPCPYFLKILAHPVYVLRDYNIDSSYKEIYKELRYTGPFIIKEISKNNIILNKNYEYYNEGSVTNEEVRISFVDSSENALAIFEDVDNTINNKIDIITDIPTSEIDRLKIEGRIKTFPSNDFYILKFNDNDNYILSGENFKTAISNLIDKGEYANNISKNLLIPIDSFLSKGTIEVDNFKGQEDYAIDYFNNLYKDEEIKIRIVYEDKSLERRIAKELSEKLSQDTKKEFIHLGYSQDELQNTLESGNYEMYISRFKGKYDYELEFFKEAVIPKSQLYMNGLNRVKYLFDEEERNRELSVCEQIIKEEGQVIPLYKVNHILCHRETIDGVYLNSYGNIVLEEVKRVR